jgi:hypothetical protein
VEGDQCAPPYVSFDTPSAITQPDDVYANKSGDSHCSAASSGGGVSICSLHRFFTTTSVMLYPRARPARW